MATTSTPAADGPMQPADMYRHIYSLVDSLEHPQPDAGNESSSWPSPPSAPTNIATTADEQIRRILSKLSPWLDATVWFIWHMKPMVTNYQSTVSVKQEAKAQQSLELGSFFYLRMKIKGDFGDKVTKYLNKAIIYAPFTSVELLRKCYRARSEVFYRAQDYSTALADVDHILNLGPMIPHTVLTITIYERKVELLKRLNRHYDAFRFVEEVLFKTADFYNSMKLGEVFPLFVQMLAPLREKVKHFRNKRSPQQKEMNSTDKAQALTTLPLQVHPQVEWAINSYNKRPYLKAKGSIAVGEQLLMEQPVLRVDEPSAAIHLQYCATCHTKCKKIIVPCPRCTEVIFCSEACASHALQDKDGGYHKWECGILGALCQPDAGIPLEVLHVYRHLVRAGGARRLLALDRAAANRTLFFPAIDGPSQLPLRFAFDCFVQSSSDQRQQIAARLTRHSTKELTIAIYLAGIYLAKCTELSIESGLDNDKDLVAFIRLLALEYYKTVYNQFELNELSKGESEKLIHLSSIQTLVSSRIDHSCQPNVKWSFTGNTFTLIAIKPIAEGDNIAISYIVNESQSLFVRLAYLHKSLRMCHCELCMSDAQLKFALKCTRCSGPIPFSSQPDPVPFTALKCLLCEEDYEHGLSQALTLEEELKVMLMNINLLRDVQSQSKDILAPLCRIIERKLGSLIVSIYPRCRPLLNVIVRLCSEYIRRGENLLAIEWHYWLATNHQIRLPITNENNDVPEQNGFLHLHYFDEWLQAYLAYMPQLPWQSMGKYHNEVLILFERAYGALGDLYGILEVHENWADPNTLFPTLLDLVCADFNQKLGLKLASFRNLLKAYENGKDGKSEVFPVAMPQLAPDEIIIPTHGQLAPQAQAQSGRRLAQGMRCSLF